MPSPLAKARRVLDDSTTKCAGEAPHTDHKESVNMPEGVVSWFNDRKGFGFITDKSGEDVFVHYSEIMRDGFQTLEKGEEVRFELDEAGQAKKAVNVVPLADNIKRL